jgi:polysaccharide biosynthesis transport protein
MTDRDAIAFDETVENEESEFHLSEYLTVLRKRARLIILCVIVAFGFAIVRSLMQKPLYRATVTIDIDKDRGTPYDVSDRIFLYSWWDPEYLPTQTRLIQSREVARRVAQKLDLVQNTDFNASAAARTSPDEVANAERRLTAAALRIQGGISVTPVKGTNLVEVSYVSTSPALAADLANALAETYIDWNLETRYATLDKAGRFIGSQIEQLKAEIRDKELQLQTYGREKGIVSPDPQLNQTMQNLDSLNKDYAAAVADRVGKQARFAEYQSRSPEALAVSLSSTTSDAQSHLARLEREYTEKRALFKDDYPAMVQLRGQIDKAREEYQKAVDDTVARAVEQARTEYLTALRREKALEDVLRNQKSAAMDLNTSAVEYNNLYVEVETKRQLLDGLLQRQNETEMTSRLQSERVSNIRVVDRALPPGGPFAPSHSRNGMMGLFVGLLGGLGLAFLLEYLDRSIRSVKQVEQYLRLPALGLIPSIGPAGLGGYAYGGYGIGRKKEAKRRPTSDTTRSELRIELIPHTKPRSTVAEAYRAIRTALLLSRAGGVRSIVVTSSLPGEGKTSTSANLATVLGQLHKNVLLVDADLHKPRLHEIFRVSNRVGLVSVLAENMDPAEATVETAVPNVFLMPAGPLSPNPSGLLASEAMTVFLDHASQHFDFVVIDSPPVSAVADAIVMGHQVDGVVLGVEGGRTPREIVARVRDKLLRSNVRILGVLINNLAEQSFDYGYYYHYYTGTYGAESGYTERVGESGAESKGA